MDINPEIYRGYDIRGVAGEDFDEESIERIGKGFGTLMHRRKIKQLVVAHDPRLSSESYSVAFIRGVISTGVDVTDIGMVMIHMLYFSQYYFQTNASAMITASHNPKQYNGFKMSLRFSHTIVDEIQELKSVVESREFFESPSQGSVTKQDISQAYYHDILKRVTLHRKLKVVVDTANGSAGPYVPELLTQAGCEVIGQHLEPDGSFPAGTPDPTSGDMIEKLSSKVKEEKADLGLAFDADADRLGVVDNEGNVLWNDVLVAIFAKEILGRFPGATIMYNTLCSQVVKKTIESEGGVPFIWRTGHSFLKEKMSEIKPPFCGELSGHFFFADNFYGHDDSCFAALRLMEYMTEQGKTLKELNQELPQYISSPEIKVKCPDELKEEVIERISKQLKKDFPGMEVTDKTVITGDDGTRIDFDDGMIVIRYSQNGPYITIKFEAQDQETYDQRKKYIKDLLMQYHEIDWKDESHSINVEFLD